MKIRPAVPEDAASIAHVHVASWRTAYRGVVPQAYLDSLEESQFAERWQTWITTETSASICVAESGGSLCGFAAGGPIRKRVSLYDGELYAIYLLPEMQRKGIGRALFSHIASELVGQKFKHMLLWSRARQSLDWFLRTAGR